MLSAFIGSLLIMVVLWESFETIIFPRRVTRRFRLTRFFYRNTWRLYLAAVFHAVPTRRRETLLSFYGPCSLLLLLTVWAGGLIVGFALLHWADGSALRSQDMPGFFTDLYMSGTNFFTLGLGDVTPRSPMAKLLTVIEGGMGLGFLALIISYLPVLNMSFQRREISISLLDARAGSPPSAVEMLRRHSSGRGLEALGELFHDWELWSAELLESHLSYPVLAYFRSQHDNQSWLGALTAILDATALVMVGVEGAPARQAELTFAMARHAVVDLCIVFKRSPRPPERDRLNFEALSDLRASMKNFGIHLQEGHDAEQHLKDLRRLYEPYAHALSDYFRMPFPPWVPAATQADNWQISAWERSSTVKKTMKNIEEDRHF